MLGRREEKEVTRTRVKGSLDAERRRRWVRTDGTLRGNSGGVECGGALQLKSGRTGHMGRRKYVACVRTQRPWIDAGSGFANAGAGSECRH